MSSCDTWSRSQGSCATLGANLPSIHSQEENVYIQSRHWGEQSWLGLSDINTEGTFVWSDGTPLDFRYWAKSQPNNFHNQDCVHTLGFLKEHKYQWNDVNCTDCHRFTCKKGMLQVSLPLLVSCLFSRKMYITIVYTAFVKGPSQPVCIILRTYFDVFIRGKRFLSKRKNTAGNF